MKWMIVAIVAIGLALVAYSYDKKDFHKRPVIEHLAEHNTQMNQCITSALDRHQGAVTEVEVEMEDGQLIFDVDIQGTDGKNWEVECVAATAQITEDKPKR